MRIADVHTHIFPEKIADKASLSIGSFYERVSCHDGTLGSLAAQEAAAGTSYFAVSSSATDAGQVSHINDFIAESVRLYDNVVGFGTLFPTMEGWEPELERIQSLGIRGIKIHSDFQKIDIDEPKAVEMYRGIARAGLPVLFHMGDWRYDYSAPERLENLIRQVPDLVAIAAHFGGYQAWDRSCAHVLPENVFYDTSSTLLFVGRERGLDMLEKMGAHRFLFGTDYPLLDPVSEVERFLDLGLDETTRDKILFGNYESLFLK